jgi:hypothetical protein
MTQYPQPLQARLVGPGVVEADSISLPHCRFVSSGALYRAACDLRRDGAGIPEDWHDVAAALIGAVRLTEEPRHGGA